MNKLTPQEIAAIKAAVKYHGRKAKSAIRQAWMDGDYRSQLLEDFDNVLHNLRNRGGRKLLDSVKLSSL